MRFCRQERKLILSIPEKTATCTPHSDPTTEAAGRPLASFPSMPLALSSHPGEYIVGRYKEVREAGPWRYTELGVGTGSGPGEIVSGIFDGQYISRVDDVHGEMVFDVIHWKYEEQNGLVLVKAAKSGGEPTRKGGGGRDFRVWEDGTISPMPVPQLILGKRGDGALCLVRRGSKNAIALRDVPGKLRDYAPSTISGKTKEFSSKKLLLKSHEGEGIVPKWTQPRDAWGQWLYIDLAVGPAANAITASYDGQFLAWNENDSPGGEMVFDVSMWQFREGNHLVLVKVAPGHASQDATRKYGGGRDFVIHDDGTISPKPAQHLVLEGGETERWSW